MSEQTDISRYDREEILDEIVDLFQSRNDWMGFRTRDEIETAFAEDRCRWIHQYGEVVCAATYRHLKNKRYTRVYFTSMRESNWHPDLWQQCINSILLESPHSRIISKTPIEVTECDLWEEIGHKMNIEDGKDRPLVVWEVVDDRPGPLEGW